jgi:hypothetical protein
VPIANETQQDLAQIRESMLDALVEEAFLKKCLKISVEGQLLTHPWARPPDDDKFVEWLQSHAEDPTVQVGWDRQGFRLLRRLERSIDRVVTTEASKHMKKGRALARYRAAAEGRRRTALKRWIELSTTPPKAGLETLPTPHRP